MANIHKQTAEYLKIRRDFRLVALLALLIVGVGVVFYHYTEGFSLIDAFYFCVITLTTVGYGDLAPVTPAGRLFTTFYVLAGVGIIAAFAQLLVRSNIARRQYHRALHEDAVSKK